jgi:hypothetical protein
MVAADIGLLDTGQIPPPRHDGLLSARTVDPRLAIQTYHFGHDASVLAMYALY